MNDERPIRALLVDDHAVVMEGTRSLIEKGSKGAIEVVGTALDGLAAIEAVQKLRPDVILMDIDMPKLDGIEATRRIRQQPDAPEVIILTALEPGEQSSRAGGAGAKGFLLKSEDPHRLITAIYDVAKGDGALSPRIAKQMLATVGRVAGNEEIQDALRLDSMLTEREKSVVSLVIDGLSNKEIAKTLILSESTIKSHLSAIQQKFSADNRVVIAVIATRAAFGKLGREA